VFNGTDADTSWRSDPRYRRVDVDTPRPQRSMSRIDVIGVQDDAGWHARWVGRARGDEGDARGCTGRVDLNPSIPVAPRVVISPLEPERLIELDRPLLIVRGHDDELQVADPGLRPAHSDLLDVACPVRRLTELRIIAVSQATSDV
jgi:hypothetical protein